MGRKTIKKKGVAAKPLSQQSSRVHRKGKQPIEMKIVPKKEELVAKANCCEEASNSSHNYYIPCNKPATRNVYHSSDKRTYRMCSMCAEHNIKKRGGIDKGIYKGSSPSILDKEFRKKAKPVETSDFEQEEASKDQLSKISEQAMQAVSLEKQINDLQAAVATLVEQRDTILNKVLPAIMDSANMGKFALNDGTEIKIKDVVAGTLPNADRKPEERKEALDWLMKNGGKGLIKTKFVSEFGVGQERAVKYFESLIKKAGMAAKKDIGVHPQTLCAFVRELLEDGKEVPLEKLGIYVGRHAKITLSDKAQEKADNERIKPKRSKVI